MNLLMLLGFASRLKQVFDYLIAYGAVGLFAIAFLDSALIPLPGGADAAMIFLTTHRPDLMPVFVLAGAVGSAAGCLVMYTIAKKAGRVALKRFSAAKQERVKGLIERYDILAVLVASLMPPPFPFKLFVISSGVFRMSAWRFALGVGIGRGVRFLLEGILTVRYGAQMQEAINNYSRQIGIAGILLLLLGIAFFAARFLLKKRQRGVTAESNPHISVL